MSNSRRKRALVLALIAAATLGWLGRWSSMRRASAAPAASGYDWLQFDFDPQHSGNNPRETIIGPANAGHLQRLFRVHLPAVADGAPAYLSAVTTASGTQNLLFLTTKAGDIVALDAQTGTPVWMQENPAGSCRINNTSGPCYTTSSPAIDPSRQFVYSYGLDGFVHKYQVGDGQEVTTGGWKELATTKPFNEKGSSALSIATARSGVSYLYVANGGYPGDRGDYQGHITAINLVDGSQRVFNANGSSLTVHFVVAPARPSWPDFQSAIWARAGVIYDPDADRIYMATGNGAYSPGSYNWGDSVFSLNPDGTGLMGDPLDSYTPANQARLNSTDEDLGSTAPALLPTPGGSAVRHLAVQAGKDRLLRLLNLDNLSGQGGPGHTGGEIGGTLAVPQGGEVLTQPAVWVNPADQSTWAFVANNNGISGLQLMLDSSGMPHLQKVWQNSSGGSSPILANGVLFYAGSGELHALDPVTGTELGTQTDIGGIHWESPIVANGIVYITDESGDLTAYSP